MDRTLVSHEKLLKLLNSELSKHEECNNCHVTSVVRLIDEDEDGCNWYSGNLRCSGVSLDVCSPIANQIIAQAKIKFNVK